MPSITINVPGEKDRELENVNENITSLTYKDFMKLVDDKISLTEEPDPVNEECLV